MSHLLRCFIRRPNAFFSTSSQSSDSLRLEVICRFLAANQWPLLRKTLPVLHTSLVSSVLDRFRSCPMRALRFFLWFNHESGRQHDVKAYGSILCILAQSGLKACLWGLVQRMLFVRGMPFSLLVVDFVARQCVKPVALDVVIVCLVKKGMFEDVVLVASAIHKTGYVLPFNICNRLVRVFKINKQMLDPDLIIFSVFRAFLCNAAKNLNDGRRCYDYESALRLENSNANSYDYESALRLENSNANSAHHDTPVLGSNDRKFLQDKNGPKSNGFRCYIHMIRALCVEGKVGVALYLRQEMRWMGLIPDIVTCNYLMDALCKCGKLSDANKLLREILQQGGMTNTCTYNILIHGYYQYDCADNAIQIFLFMIKSGIRPNKVTCNILVHILCNKGLPEVGKNVLAEILNKKVTLDLINSTILIKDCFMAGNMVRAFKIWDEMIKHGIVVDVMAYNVLIDGFSSSSNMGFAFGILAEMFKKGFSPDVISYNSLIDGLCREGKLTDACNIHNHISIMGITPDHISYRLIIRGLCMQGYVTVAQVFFYKMLDDFIVPDLPVWNFLIYGYGKVGEVGHSIKVRNWMHEFGHRPNVFTYNALIYTHLKKGNLQDALLLKKEMLRDGCVPDVVTYNLLIRGVRRTGNIASQLYYEMSGERYPPDIYTYTELICGFCIRGEVEEAEKLLMLVLKSGLSVDHVPFHTIIKKYCRIKAPEKAYVLYEMMKGLGIVSHFSTYCTLMVELKKKGFKQEAYEVFNSIKLQFDLQSGTFV